MTPPMVNAKNILGTTTLPFLIALLILSACSRNREGPTSTPAPTPAPQQLSQPVNLINQELLNHPKIETDCDHSTDTQFSCTLETSILQVEINAANFARWRLYWSEEPTQRLNGSETLTFNIRRQGEVTPNLYIGTEDGQRIAVNLARYGLKEGWHTLRIPIYEFQDDEGNRLDFAQINEIQIVFEWADMAGELELASLRFDSKWQEEVAVEEESLTLAEALELPDGFQAVPVVDNMREMTQIVFTPTGDMLVSQQSGRVWWYRDQDSDGRYEQRHLYAAGFSEIVGLLYDPNDGSIWIGGRGQLYQTLDRNGDQVADERIIRIDNLPWGRHQNNGLAWNPDPDPYTGEAGQQWVYFGLGSTGDLENGGELNSTVLRFPRMGKNQDDLEVVSQGNRNAYALAWGAVPVDLNVPDGEKAWQLFASENGPDFNDAPDEVNHIRWQHHYGFPEQFGLADDPESDGKPYSGPLYPVTAHASASGLAYIDHPAWPSEYQTLYVSLFGQIFGEGVAGHRVDRITLAEVESTTSPTYRGQPTPFVIGLDRPLPMATGPDRNLWIGDYATGVVYQVRYEGSQPD